MYSFRILISFLLCGWIGLLHATETLNDQCILLIHQSPTLAESTIADALGWVPSNRNHCGGYYYEPAFIKTEQPLNKDLIYVTGDEGTYSMHSTSIYEGDVTLTENGQQIKANKAYVYREPVTEKYSYADLVGNVILREPNDLVRAKCGRIYFQTKNKSLYDILYRTAVYGLLSKKPGKPTIDELTQKREVVQLSAWGKAQSFKQEEPKVYQFQSATYSTCPPTHGVWQVRSSHIVLNKNTGRGTAQNARLYLKGVPIFYWPYLNFPIDDRRQTGFLFPRPGTSSSYGPYLETPFYWNIAPNYDDTITPAFLSKRGLQINNLFRYLTPKSRGEIGFSVLPGDREFENFKTAEEEGEDADSTNPATQSELNRLKNTSSTRKAIYIIDDTRFNEHWSSDINFNYVGDDYYLKNFRNNLTEVTPNQLLQEADLNYKGEYWQFFGRLQGYQTLHPIDETPYSNQYFRLPQLVLEGNYLSDKTGLDYFIYNDFTHFEIHNNPGQVGDMPISNRGHSQPGISFPYYRPSFYVVPRLQMALTQYSLQQVNPEGVVENTPGAIPTNQNRALPIFDINSGLYFDRNVNILSHPMRQTLEPQVFYTYVPYRNQSDIPIFDTTTNTLTYDQLFTYNRFSGLDRIGDANQISVGVLTRFIEDKSGNEKIRAGIGQIYYFRDRRVTLCYNGTIDCDTQPLPDENTERTSPLSAMLLYTLTPNWSVRDDTIWNSTQRQLDNNTLSLSYVRDSLHLVSLSYSYVRNGDPQFDEPPDSDANNLSQTDLTFTWGLSRDWSAIGRWTQSWNQGRFQNLLYGVQYDSCCWAVRFVAGRVYTNQTVNNTYAYNTEFYLQFALKGLGNIGTGDPGQVINSTIVANKNYFGHDY